jgi:hypothetical protein
MADTKVFDRRINLYINGETIRNDMKSIVAVYAKAKNELNNIIRGTAEYNAKAEEVRKIKAIMDEHNAGLRTSSGLWGKIKDLIPIASFAAVSGTILKLGKDLFDLSKRMEAESRRSNIVFGESLGYVEQEADKLAKKMGVTNKEFVAMAAATGDLLVPLGFTRDQAAKMSVELQTLTGALDEWTGGKVGAAEISNILTKAMLGENEQLKQLGIAIRLDSDEYKNLVTEKLKMPGVTKAQAQALAELQLIQEKSVDAQTAYTQGGNVLLRMQKSLGAGWRSLKESIVESLSADAADKLRQEGILVNALTAELYNLNTPQERRLEIYNQLKQIAPGIVKTLDNEKRATLATRDALIEYNKQMVNRIVLAKADKEIEKERENIAKATEARLKTENEAIAAIQSATKSMPGYATVINSILTDSSTVYEKLVQLQQLGIDINKTSGSVVGGVKYQTVKSDYLNAVKTMIDREQEQVNKLISILDQRDYLAKRLGIILATPSVSPNETANPSKSKEDLKEKLDGINKEGNAEYEKFLKSTDLANKEYKIKKEIQEKQKTDYAEFLEITEKANEENLERRKIKEEKAEQDRLEKAKIAAEQKIAIEEQFYSAGEKLMDAAFQLKNILLKKQMDIELSREGITDKESEAIRLKYAKKEREWQIGQILVLGAIASLKAWTMSSTWQEGLKRQIAVAAEVTAASIIATAQPLYTGGYTRQGGKYEPAGIVHAGEWVANADMVSSPVTGPIIKALEQTRVKGMSGYKDGGIVTDTGKQGTGSPALGSSPALISTSPILENTLLRMVKLLDKIDRDGVTAVAMFDYKAVDNLREGIVRLNRIENDVTM